MAHIIGEPPRDWAASRMATPAPVCPHGTAYAQPCYSCGWTCPACKRSYAPWVRECNYRHEGGEPASLFGEHPVTLPAGSPGAPRWAVMSLRFPPEWSEPGYQHLVRAGDQWRDILPGLQCRVGGLVSAGGLEPGFDEAIVHFRLTLGPGSDDPA